MAEIKCSARGCDRTMTLGGASGIGGSMTTLAIMAELAGWTWTKVKKWRCRDHG